MARPFGRQDVVEYIGMLYNSKRKHVRDRMLPPEPYRVLQHGLERRSAPMR